jgi:hypothetical protein
MSPEPRMPWWKREIRWGRPRTATVFVLGVLAGVVLFTVFGVCLRQFPLGGDWRIMAATCGVFGLEICGLAECARIVQSARKKTANLGDKLILSVAVIAWLIALTLLRPMGQPMSSALACFAMLLVLGVLALARDACRATVARRNRNKKPSL